MCLITFAWRDEEQHLQLYGNRDEFYARPTQPADFWEDGQCWGGRDLQAGGSWLALRSGPRMAALTNIRNPDRPTGTRSRGELVADFVTGSLSAQDYARQIQSEQYGGFNLLLLDDTGLYYIASHRELRRLPSGLYGLSNDALNTPWPKVRAVVAAWRDNRVQQAMLDPTRYPDEALPNTGVSMEWERRLSAAFIESPDYGTRALSYVELKQGKWRARETSFGPLTGVRSVQDL